MLILDFFTTSHFDGVLSSLLCFPQAVQRVQEVRLHPLARQIHGFHQYHTAMRLSMTADGTRHGSGTYDCVVDEAGKTRITHWSTVCFRN